MPPSIARSILARPKWQREPRGAASRRRPVRGGRANGEDRHRRVVRREVPPLLGGVPGRVPGAALAPMPGRPGGAYDRSEQRPSAGNGGDRTGRSKQRPSSGGRGARPGRDERIERGPGGPGQGAARSAATAEHRGSAGPGVRLSCWEEGILERARAPAHEGRPVATTVGHDKPEQLSPGPPWAGLRRVCQRRARGQGHGERRAMQHDVPR